MGRAPTKNRSPLKTSFLRRDDTFGTIYDGSYGEPTEPTEAVVVDETTNTAHERGTPERGATHAESSATGTHRGPALSREEEEAPMSEARKELSSDTCADSESGRKSEPAARGKKRCAHDAGGGSDKERAREGGGGGGER